MATINLLPPGYQRIIAVNRYRSYAFGFLLVIMVAMALTYFGSYYARYRLHRQTGLLTRQLATVKPAARSFDQIADEADRLAANAKEVVDLTGRVHQWPVFFNYIEQSLPTDAYIRSISTSPDKGNYTVIISGVAQSRKSVGVFREKLLSYKMDGETTERVSQVIIDSITSGTDTTEQLFSLRVTMNIEPLK